MKILAIIPVRGGSKGIPQKNIRAFNGQPLIALSLEAAKQSSVVDRVIVSTESQEIADISIAHGAEVPILRPTEMAGDSSPVIDAVIHMLDYLRDREQYEPTHILLLQATSPLRRASDIDAAVQLYQERGADSLVSVCRTENALYFKREDDVLESVVDGYRTRGNRQELPVCYKLDGSMIYLVRTDLFRETRSFFSGRLVGYEVERWRAVDLDEIQDFVIGELIHKHRDEIAKDIQNFK
ncbi:MAG: acylneuraminate cytidylyltransferase family protein [Patescibacteria group bacterium]